MYPFRSRGSLRYIGEAFLFDDLLHVPPEVSGPRSCLGCRASLVSPLEPEGGIVLRLRRPRTDNGKRRSRDIRHLSSRDWNTLKEAGDDSRTRADRVSSLGEYSAKGGSSWLRAKKDEGRYREDNSTVETLTTSATSVDGKRGTGVGSCFSRGSEDLSLSTERSPRGGFSSPPRDGEAVLPGQKQPELTPGRLVESDGIRITDLVHGERRRVREEGRDPGEENSESDEDEFLFFPTRVYCSGGSRGQTDIPSPTEAVARLSSRQAGDRAFEEDSSSSLFSAGPVGHPLAEQGALREREDLARSVSSREVRELGSEAEGQGSDDGNDIREPGDSGRRIVGDLTKERREGHHSRPDSTGNHGGHMLQYMGSRSFYGFPRKGGPENLFALRILGKQQPGNRIPGGNTVTSTLRDMRRLSDSDRRNEGNQEGFLPGGGRRAFTMLDDADDAPAQRGALGSGLIDTGRHSAGWCTASRREPDGQGDVLFESEADHPTGFSPPTEPAGRRQPCSTGRGSARAGEIVDPSHLQAEVEGDTDSGLVGLRRPASQHQSGHFEADLADLSRTRGHGGACAKGYSSVIGHSRNDSRDVGVRPAGFFGENTHTSHADGAWPGSCPACSVRSVVRRLPDIGERPAHDLLGLNSYERPRGDQIPGQRDAREHSGCAPTGSRGERYSTIRRTSSLGERHSPVFPGRSCSIKEDFRVGARGVSSSRRESPPGTSGGSRSRYDWVGERQDGQNEAHEVIEAARARTRGMTEDTSVSGRARGISFAGQSEGDEESMKEKAVLLRSWQGGRRSLVYSFPEGDILDTARDQEDYLLSQGTGDFFTPRTPRRSVSTYTVDPSCRAASTGHTVESRAPFTGDRFSSLSFSDRRPFSSHLLSSSSGTDSRGSAFEDVRSFASTRSFSVGSRICCQPSEKGELDLHRQHSSDGFSPGDPIVLSSSSRSASFRERGSVNRGREWLGRVDAEELGRGVEGNTRRQWTFTGELVTEGADGRREDGLVVPSGHARRSRETGGLEPFYRSRVSSPGDEESCFPLRTLGSSGDKHVSERRALSASPVSYPKRASTSTGVQLSGEHDWPLVVGGRHLSGGLLSACRPTAESGSQRDRFPRPGGTPSATSEEKESLRGSGSYSDRDSLYLTPRED